jgi:2-oxoisovalerate dehydrogenase E1 component
MVAGRGMIVAVSGPASTPHDDLDLHVRRTLAELDAQPSASDADPRELALFDAMAGSRLLDIHARRMRERGQGYYTIGSSGHESNAYVAAALRPTDPALLHYRSGGFYLARARQAGSTDGARDILLGLVGSADEPIAGGRHKVFGNAAYAVIPQTSTIGSHLPRSVGVALAIERARRLGVRGPWPADAITVCSFGDASANHSTTVGAIHAACWSAYQGQPIPLLFLCEDNGIGISVRTPQAWIHAAYSGRPGLEYFAADGADPAAVYDTAVAAARWVRDHRRPAFLHLSTVRFGGHAGSDVESAYRGPDEISADYARDPLLGTARLLVQGGVATPTELAVEYSVIGTCVAELADSIRRTPNRLSSAAQVMAPIAEDHSRAVRGQAVRAAEPDLRRQTFGSTLPEQEGPLTVAQAINRGLLDAAASNPNLIVFGEDVARKGGVYGVTRGLARRLGADRVFDTLLDEQTIFGTALGAGLAGLLPIPEIQYLAYLHNAEDQLRGEAATLSFFSQGQYRNPMVVRIAGYAYQKGFGGHFHNDNSVAVLRDIPGVIIASPARPDDAAAMLRTCVAAAAVDGRVCAYLEPIALYHTRDLFEAGDDEWLAPYAAPDEWLAQHVPLGAARTYGDGRDLTILTFANGLHMSLRVARRLTERGIGVRVVDLRWLAPLPAEDMLSHARATNRVLVVDETRRTGGVGDSIIGSLLENGYTGQLASVSSQDSFIPLGEAANLVLLNEAEIEKASHQLLDQCG